MLKRLRRDIGIAGESEMRKVSEMLAEDSTDTEEAAKTIEMNRDGEFDEDLFIDGRSGEEVDPVKVKEAREEEIRELERRVYVEAGASECWPRLADRSAMGGCCEERRQPS